MNERTCKECNEVFNDSEQVRRHLRKHDMTFQEYSLKWVFNGVVPACRCGCGAKTSWNVAKKSYTDFIHGHHAFGRKKSDEEKQKIGEKNSVRMKKYFKDNPDKAKLRGEILRSNWSDEIENKRIESTRKSYALMTENDKLGFKERTKKRWESGELREAHKKAMKTFNERIAKNEYDFSKRNENLSRVIAQKHVDGSWNFVKGFYVSTKTKQKCYYRSSWELQLMNELDADTDVLSWRSEFTSIPYLFEGITHHYVPDFHVVRSECQQLVEVKPAALRSMPKIAAKRVAAIEYCAQKCWEYVEWEPGIINETSSMVSESMDS
jgi:hypothetical protein